MPVFNKQASYVSEITRFISELKQTNPTLEAEQQSGRARLWDKQKIDLEEMRRVQESRVKQKAYVYQSE
ncbi:MAG: DUF3460 family protein [Oxalobacteraceae bacterium]|nr:DUF3460 family protein [Oxalobacteraceae bacterium]